MERKVNAMEKKQSLIASHVAGFVLKGDGFQISSEAKARKAKDPSVIDATLGTFYYDDNQFRAFPIVKKILGELAEKEDLRFYPYSTSDGGKDVKEALLNWEFGKERSGLEASGMAFETVTTPGGTGALTLSFANALDEGETILVPGLCWSPYNGIATSRGLKVVHYDMFAGDAFNMAGFKAAANEIIKAQGKFVTIVNDPCNNPTGYTMTDAELEEIIDFLNASGVPCVFIYDTAYIDFDFRGRDAARAKMRLFQKANDNVLISCVFSASKTFFVYGQRFGAQIIMSKNKEAVESFYTAANYYSRNTWSNANKGINNMLIEFDRHPEKKEELYKEVGIVREELKARACLFMKEAKEVGLPISPYEGGYFLVIPCEKVEEYLTALKEEEKVYLLPNYHSVRLALCSLALKEIPGLAGRLLRVLKSVE